MDVMGMLKRVPYALMVFISDIIYGVAWSAILCILTFFRGPALYKYIKSEIPSLTVVEWLMGALSLIFAPLREYVFYAPYRAFRIVVFNDPVLTL